MFQVLAAEIKVDQIKVAAINVPAHKKIGVAAGVILRSGCALHADKHKEDAIILRFLAAQ